MSDDINRSPDQGNESGKAGRKAKFGFKWSRLRVNLKPGRLLVNLKPGKLLAWLKPSNLCQPKEGSAFSDIRKAFCHLKPQRVITSLGLGLLGIYLLTGIYTVNPGEQAVIRRFGAVLPQAVNEGIHYRLPYPIDQVQKVSVSEVRRADIGMSLPEHVHQADDAPQDIQLLTGDENVITSQAIVHYKVKDATKFLYGVSGNSEQLVRYSVEAALVKAMANMAVDDILSTEKVRIQNTIMQQTQGALDAYDAGIQVTAFNIQAITPPGEVADAFLDVTTAKEEKETAINEANGYYNSLIPEARAKANSTLSQAESYKVGQVNSATGEAEKFLSMLKEYRNNSKIYTQDTTQYRLLLETFEKIFPKVKKYIVDSADGSVDVRMFDPNIVSGEFNPVP